MKVNVIATAASLLSVASARIVGFAAPSTVAPDSDVKIQIVAENYIQTIQDVAVSFGLSPAATNYPGSLGELLSSKFIGKDNSNIIGNITHYVHIPATTEKGDFVLGAAHFSLVGATLSPDIESYALNVTVGDNTSSDYVMSHRVETSS